MAEAKKKKEDATLRVDVKKADGSSSGQVSLAEAALGGMVRSRLMHSATVMYHANTRAGTHSTKNRGEVAGSTKKLYRQKGTGRARAGSRKSGTRLHGGVIHGPRPRTYGFEMPKKQRRAATNSALLGKLKDGEVIVVDGFGLTAPKTSAMAEALAKTGAIEKGKRNSVLILTDGYDENVYLSGRNIEGVEILPVQDLNAREALVHKKLVFTKAAFDKMSQLASRTYEKKVRKLKGTRKGAAPAAAPSAPKAGA